MDPVNDSPQPITAYCRTCGKGLTPDAVINHMGTVYCAEHAPAADAPPPQPPKQEPASGFVFNIKGQPVDSSASPGLAFLLGLIPGVGAIYNGQYAKGFVHVLIAGLLFSLARQAGPMEPMFDLFIPVWFFYMAFEAYHTAKKRLQGETVDEFSSIFPVHGAGAGFPMLPIF